MSLLTIPEIVESSIIYYCSQCRESFDFAIDFESHERKMHRHNSLDSTRTIKTTTTTTTTTAAATAAVSSAIEKEVEEEEVVYEHNSVHNEGIERHKQRGLWKKHLQKLRLIL
ncbi:hypothetical protein PP707_03265 [Acetobacter pasteurianus]|nr:hypothetical protein [Acetobacter pasteurianus]